MIYLTDLSVLMQRVIALDICFMIAQSIQPHHYYLFLSKHNNRFVHLDYFENEGLIIQDENEPIAKMDNIDSVVDFVAKNLNIEYKNNGDLEN